ncbi:hypothetical protein PHYBOEH_008612 [Phytophthora boehmeriae]|uniref:Bzip transcription factor n=1 Tax=Phytophthora boehmeriae TaxID=109152 RepID=A0A8T1W3I4_9STRA|nr:hypothetical protein PHYBOEH_008612 [Phytophthora boehmeriae]
MDNTNSIHPPNFHQLSEAVIGQVLLRSTTSRETTEVVKESTSKTRLPLPQSAPTTAVQTFDDTVCDYAERIYRERHRVHQARYRQNMVNKKDALEHDVQKLKEHIIRLEMQRQLISSRSPMKTTPWQMATQYFRLFRFGYHPTKTASATQGLCGAKGQRDFIVSVLAPDLSDIYGKKSSVEALLVEWQLVSTCFEDMEMELECLELGDGNSINASCTTTSTITEKSLGIAFPRLLCDPANEFLIGKLLGRQLVVRGVVNFEWDDVNDRVVSVQYKADMLTPLLGLLGNIEDVSCVFNSNFITPECEQKSMETSFSTCA